MSFDEAPATDGGQVTVGSWLEPHNVAWSFAHTRELIPTQRVRASKTPRELATASVEKRDIGATMNRRGSAAGELYNVTLSRSDGSTGTVGEVLSDTHTDGWLVKHKGQLLVEEYRPGLLEDQPHLLMSVSKSVVGCVAGVLVGDGTLELDQQVTHYVPELLGSGYEGATVGQVVDMRSGVFFREEYSNPDAEVRQMDHSIGWRHEDDQHGRPRGLHQYLGSLHADLPHGGVFSYRSCETDVLGWVCERAAGVRMADLIATKVWGPMGAEHDADLLCDGYGSAVHDGGLCATLRDVARFGQLLLDDGRVGAGSTASQVVPTEWLVGARTVDLDVRSAFAQSSAEATFTGGWYRNQLWFKPGLFGDVMLGLGIHGQLIHVSRRTHTVCVKLSSWPEPQSGPMLYDTLRACDAIGGHLAGLDSHQPSTTVGGVSGVVAGETRGLASRRSGGGSKV